MTNKDIEELKNRVDELVKGFKMSQDRIAELEEKCTKKQNEIVQLRAKWDFLMTRATEQAHESIKQGHLGLVQITTIGERAEMRALKDKISELESELAVKENLLKIKNGLCERSDKKFIDEFLNYEPSNKEDDIAQFNYESLKFWADGMKREDRIAELEDRHQSDCIAINQLHTALDVMTEKYQRLKEMRGL